MTTKTITAGIGCDPATQVTRSLLGYGMIAGPLYVAVSLAQALVRPGFDLRRHQWSLLATGDLGWVQVANFLVTGAMVLAFAVGLRRDLGTTWAPRLVAGYGLGLVAAGIFRADPASGFPAGTPDGPGTVSWHGLLHLASGAVGFGCLIAACFVVGRRYARDGRAGFAAYSRVTGIVFLAGFVAVATGAGAVWANLAFVGSVLFAWAWLVALAADRFSTR
jgi:hypothetical protein